MLAITTTSTEGDTPSPTTVVEGEGGYSILTTLPYTVLYVRPVGRP